MKYPELDFYYSDEVMIKISWLNVYILVNFIPRLVTTELFRIKEI